MTSAKAPTTDLPAGLERGPHYIAIYPEPFGGAVARTGGIYMAKWLQVTTIEDENRLINFDQVRHIYPVDTEAGQVVLDFDDETTTIKARLDQLYQALGAGVIA